MIAHVDCKTGRKQSLKEHCYNVAKICGQLSCPLKLRALSTLSGLLHDMGKGTQLFQSYLLIAAGFISGKAQRGSVHHAPIGALFVYRRWYSPDMDVPRKIAAQLLMLTIYGHHSGLMDVITPDGQNHLLDCMEQDTEALHYDEAVNTYLLDVCSFKRLDDLFSDAVLEVQDFLDKLNKSGVKDKVFMRGLLARELLGILVDADRLDSSCFVYGKSMHEVKNSPNWGEALKKLCDYLTNINRNGTINQIRARISEECEKATTGNNRLYRLSVPTGGGKTFASLRFALKYAQAHSLEIKRIFYVIPFNTILDQNAKDIKDVLGDTLRILEHHSNVVYLGENADEEYENYRHLTERWDGDLILTSMVQFLNCFFSADNSDARRVPHLSGSILIFDEIQSLPKKCTRLFENVIDFLTEFCGCLVVLCTATQPSLQFHLSPVELVPDVPKLFKELKRTRIINETQVARTYFEASKRAGELMQRYGSVLMIVNTKEAAHEMAERMKEEGFPTVHLSTDMVPAHRIKIIESIRRRDRGQPVFCVSTALIEAGINISFPCVIRSLAGLSSILQAAGRCNRNGELGEGNFGDVYIWLLSEERLRNLPEIATAQQVTYGILASDFVPDSPRGIDQYFENERRAFEKKVEYPIEALKSSLTDLFGSNKISRKMISEEKGTVFFPIPGAFHVVGEKFQVIDSRTKSVLVPYERGEEIITRLCASNNITEKTGLLREAQRYSVSLYENRFVNFCHEGKIQYDENSGVYILMKEYYSYETGVVDNSHAMDYLYI